MATGAETTGPAGMNDDELVARVREFLPSYEQPQQFFSGHNDFAELVRELLNRYGGDPCPACGLPGCTPSRCC